MSEFTLSLIAFARALVIGPSGVIEDVGMSNGMTLGCSASSPPLGKIRPRIEIFITMVGREILDVEDVAHIVLVAREVDLVSVVVLAC